MILLVEPGVVLLILRLVPLVLPETGIDLLLRKDDELREDRIPFELGVVILVDERLTVDLLLRTGLDLVGLVAATLGLELLVGAEGRETEAGLGELVALGLLACCLCGAGELDRLTRERALCARADSTARRTTPNEIIAMMTLIFLENSSANMACFLSMKIL